MTPKPFFYQVIPLLGCLFSSAAHAEWFTAERAIMGTVIQVELWHQDVTQANQAIDAVLSEMRRIDSDMSPYKADSELSLVNREAAQHPVKISKELFDLIQKSLQISELSAGAFDITFASIGYRYDYRKKIKPSEQVIRATLANIDYHHIVMDAEKQTIRFKRPGVRIDLGGIAKGYAVDNCIKILQARGIKQALVTAGGDTRIIGDHGGRPWIVGIRDPRKKGKSRVVLPLSDTAISTSGDYERFFIKDGVRYHHIISPKTGHSASEVRSVSILGSDATTTDALSTTVFILGVKKGMQLVASLPGIEAVIIDKQGKLYYSNGLADPRNNQQ